MRNHNRASSHRGITRSFFLYLLAYTCFFFLPSASDALTDITITKHNLSVSGPGTIKSMTESRICVFCHTPHNAAPSTPLWNKDLKPWSYTFYTSPTLKSPQPIQPTGPTKLCLSCHDGMTAIGAVLNPPGNIAMLMGVTTMPVGSLSNLGTNLSSDHPVSFSYGSALPNVELVSSPPPNLQFGGVDELHCMTCHDPHDDTNGMFLAMDNRFSALCITCHQMEGWASSGHATSGDSVAGILPIPPQTWPTWSTVAEWGCEVCHTPHFAANPPWLLDYTSTDYCLSCHSPVPSPPPSTAIHGESAIGQQSSVSSQGMTIPDKNMADIRSQIKKISSHSEQPGTLALHNPKESPRTMVRHVTCTDCHNAHMANKQTASAPNVSGMTRGVEGVDKNGIETASARYEYEICFKCHADYSLDFPYIPRVVSTVNTRIQFNPINPSYHPVIGMGKNLNIPSIPSNLNPGLVASSIMYCTDCHSDDSGGSKGPHGSSFAPILRERYETADGTQESYQNYALCYRCHNRESILNDASFKRKIRKTTATGGGHSGHLAKGAPCSACHDPHGISVTSLAPQGTGSHTHLINFDMRIVMPQQGSKYPIFTATGTFSGSCTLVCHGRVHINASYP